jgi:hypothetical protein
MERGSVFSHCEDCSFCSLGLPIMQKLLDDNLVAKQFALPGQPGFDNLVDLNSSVLPFRQPHVRDVNRQVASRIPTGETCRDKIHGNRGKIRIGGKNIFEELFFMAGPVVGGKRCQGVTSSHRQPPESVQSFMVSASSRTAPVSRDECVFR